MNGAWMGFVHIEALDPFEIQSLCWMSYIFSPCTHAHIHTYIHTHILLQVLFPLLERVNQAVGSASTSSFQTSLLIHHSRDTAQKQWAETQVNLIPLQLV